MAYLNANIPPIYCKVRKEYLYDMDEKYKKQSSDCVVFGLTSISGRALLFNIMFQMVHATGDYLFQLFSKRV